MVSKNARYRESQIRGTSSVQPAKGKSCEPALKVLRRVRKRKKAHFVCHSFMTVLFNIEVTLPHDSPCVYWIETLFICFGGCLFVGLFFETGSDWP